MAPNVEFSGVPAGQARHCAAQPAATVVERADSATGVVECGSLNVSNNEALRAATEAVLSALDKTPVQNMTLEVHDRREALRAALTQPAASGEPVAWIEGPHGEIRRNLLWKLDPMPPQSVAWSIPLYTMSPKATSGTCTPQPAPARVPLTLRQVSDATHGYGHVRSDYVIAIARAIEAAHGITAPGTPDAGPNV